MNWRSLFLENWPYKLAAAALALLLWFNVTAEERQELPVPTRLQVESRDEGWIVVGYTEGVRTLFQGRRGDVMGLSVSGQLPAIRQVIDSVTGPRMEIDLSADQVDYNRSLSVRPVAVEPHVAQVRLERSESRQLPVHPSVEASAAESYSVRRPIAVQPETVTVTGARSEVNSLDRVTTEPVTMEDLKRTVTRELRLRLPAGIRHTDVEPTTVLATVEVDTLVERTLTLPLALRGRAAEAVATDTDSVAVTLRGPRGAVEALSVEALEAWVEVEEPPGEVGGTGTVHVEVPEGAQLTAIPEPSEVALRRTGGR